jgi:hypothetical protein
MTIRIFHLQPRYLGASAAGLKCREARHQVRFDRFLIPSSNDIKSAAKLRIFWEICFFSQKKNFSSFSNSNYLLFLTAIIFFFNSNYQQLNSNFQQLF